MTVFTALLEPLLQLRGTIVRGAVDRRWQTEAEQAILNWFLASDSIHMTHVRGGDDSMLRDCLDAYCSELAFWRMDRLTEFVMQEAGWSNLAGRKGMVFGCDWGFPALHLAEAWKPEQLVAVDVTGKYAGPAQEILSRHAESLPNVVIAKLGPAALGKYRDHFDFVIITKSFTLLDTEHSRRELSSVLATVKAGGVLLFDSLRKPGQMPFADYLSLLPELGFSEVRLQSSPAVYVSRRLAGLVGPQDPRARFLISRRERTPPQSQLDLALSRAGQDRETLLRRRPAIDYPKDETIVTRVLRLKQHLEQGDVTLQTLPLSYTLNMISVCNIKCIFCDYPDLLRHYSIPESFLKDILDTLDGTMRVQLTGGETLLSKGAHDVITKSAAQPWLQVELISNMTKVSAEQLEGMAEGVTFLTCSLDAATKATYDQIRQDSDWDTVIGNLKSLVALKRKSGNAYPLVEINFIVLGQNIHEIADFVDLAQEIGADQVSYKWLYWTLTPRITEAARVDLKDDAVARRLCVMLLEAERRCRRAGLPVVWEPVPYYIRAERPELFAEYGLEQALRKPWQAQDRVVAVAPRAGTRPAFSHEELETATRGLRTMPDGQMPCIAPFSTLQINTPESANFCCYSTAEYAYIPIDSSGSLLSAWNHPKLLEARRHFLKGDYEKTCRSDCALYRQYLRNSGRVDLRPPAPIS